MENLTQKTAIVKFMHVGLYGDSDAIAWYSANRYDTLEEAVKDWEVTCRDRKKGDEYDAYWNSVPCIILQEKVERELLIPSKITV